MAVARSIFTLGRGVQLLWAAFDPIFIVVPLKVALGWDKLDFWAFQKIITPSEFFQLCFLNSQKSNFSNPNATFSDTTVTGISKAAHNN